MPFVFDKDLYGSSKTEAYSSVARDSGVRYIMVKDPNFPDEFDNTVADKATAIAAVKAMAESEEGNAYPGDPSLPIASITATRFGPSEMLTTVRYRRPSGGGGGGMTNELEAVYSGGTRGIQIYRSSWLTTDDPGQGDGQINFDRPNAEKPDDCDHDVLSTGLPWGDVMLDKNLVPERHTLERTIVHVGVKTTLAFNPYSLPHNVGFFINKVNATTTIFGHPGQFGRPELRGIFGPESVLCNAPHVRQMSAAGGGILSFDVEYSFSIIDGKWYKQDLASEADDLVQIVNNRPMYEKTDFDGAFPMGTIFGQGIG